MATLNVTSDLSAKLLTWQELTRQIDELKKTEMTLRHELVNSVIPEDKVEGATTFEIGNGWKLTATRKQSYSLDSKHVDALVELLPENIFNEVVRYKAELSLTGYKKSLPAYIQGLPEERRKEVCEAVVNAVTIKAAMPELKLIAPKQEN